MARRFSDNTAATKPFDGTEILPGIQAAGDVKFTMQELARSLGTSISPAQITANTDNYAPAGLATCGVLRLSTDASRNLTGITAQSDGAKLLLMNIGANPLVLKHDVTSTAANRFYCPGSVDFRLAANTAAWISYDLTSSRWRVASAAAPTGTGWRRVVAGVEDAAAINYLTESIGSGGALLHTGGLFDATNGGYWVQRESGASRFLGVSAAAQAQFIGARSGGTLAAPTATGTGASLVDVYGSTYGGSTWAYPVGIHLATTEVQSETARGCKIGFSTTTNGTTASATRFTIEDNGHFVPAGSNTYDIGTSSVVLRAIYVTTPTAGDNSTKGATTAYVRANTGIGTYKNLYERESSHTAARTTGTYAIASGDPAPISGTGTLDPWGVFYFDPADHPTVDGLALKLRIRAQVHCNDVAPGASFVIALHPVSRPATSGGAGVVIYTIDAAVASSACPIVTTPAADSSTSTVTAADFAAPAAGFYCLGFVQSVGSIAASAHLHIAAQLQMRNA